MESVEKRFKTPEEEIEYLREQLALQEKESEWQDSGNTVEKIADFSTTKVAEYGAQKPEHVLDDEYQMKDAEVSSLEAIIVEIKKDAIDVIGA